MKKYSPLISCILLIPALAFARGLNSSGDNYIEANNIPAISISGTTGLVTIEQGIKLPETQACSSDLKGIIRYNSSTNSVQFCDGSSWRGIGGFSTCKTITAQGPDARAAAYCESGWTMVGGGCSNVSSSLPITNMNGWYCGPGLASQGGAKLAYVRCCQ